MSVDAIMGTVKAHQPFIGRCLDTLQDQVDKVFLVLDGWKSHMNWHSVPVVLLPRDRQHSPGTSFNYGAHESDADWLLYVDPHVVFKEGAVAAMLKLAEEDNYDVVFGTGRHYPLRHDSPWIHALGPTVNKSQGPFTFLMRRRLWDQLGGIPEPRQGHMDALTSLLLERGVMAGKMENMCLHLSEGDWRYIVDSFYNAGRCYAMLDLEYGVEVPVTTENARRFREVLTPANISTLWALLLNSAYQLGVADGYGLQPGEPQTIPLKFQWLPPLPEEEP